MKASHLCCAVALLCFGASGAHAGCVTASHEVGHIVGYDYIKLQLVNISGAIRNRLEQGMSQWNASSCNTGGVSFPYFSLSPPSGTSQRAITVTLHAGFNPENDMSCGRFVGNTIEFYENAKKPGGATLNCTSGTYFPDSVAHELGHTIGLEDQYGSNCSSYALGQLTFNSSGLYVNRTVRAQECQKVRDTNYTPYEQEYDNAEQGCEGDPSCDPYACGPSCNPSPILLDLDRNQFHLAGAGAPVSFDIDADGAPESITWTDLGTADAFLCFDRNGNGVIDDGSELFGNATPLENGDIAPHGYVALAELDQNSDDWITSQDVVFAQLAVWVDSNHDGVSDPGEIVSLSEAGVQEIGLDFFVTRRQDQFGNRFYYNGRAWIDSNGHRKQIWTSDVFFVLVE